MNNLFKKIETLFGIDGTYFLKGGSWLLLGQVTIFITAFLLTLAYANFLPKDIYGNFNFIVSLTTILAIPTLGGMNQAVVRAITKGLNNLFIPAFKTKLRWGLITFVATLGTALYYLLIQRLDLGLSLLIAAPLIPLYSAFLLYESFWNGQKKFNQLTKYDIINQLGLSLFIFLTILLSDNLYLLIGVYFGWQTLINLILFLRTRSNIKITSAEEDNTITYGKHLTAIGILDIIATHLDSILIWTFLGPISVAVYSFARLPVKQLENLFGKILGPLAFPKLAEQNIKQLKSLPKKIIKLYLVMAPGVLLYIILAPIIYKFFYPQYLEAIIYTRFISLVLLAAPCMFFGTALQAQMKHRALYWQSVSSNLVRIGLFLIFIPIYGIWGVIIALLTYYTFNCLILYILFKKYNLQ